MTNIHEIEDFSMPSGWKPPKGFKSYKPRKRKEMDFWSVAVLVGATIWIVLALNSVVDSILPKKAHAQVKTAKDCMSNSCVCDFLGDYVNGGDFAGYCSKI